MINRTAGHTVVNTNKKMEINGSMAIRFSWLLGVVILVSIAFLVACGSHYKASSDGLVIVPSLGSGVVQTFSFSLSNGHPSAISNPPVIPGPPSQGAPTSVVLDPAGLRRVCDSIRAGVGARSAIGAGA